MFTLYVTVPGKTRHNADPKKNFFIEELPSASIEVYVLKIHAILYHSLINLTTEKLSNKGVAKLLRLRNDSPHTFTSF